MDAFEFAMVCMVTWRITHLLSKEDGPFDLIFLLRKKAGAGFFGSLLDCFYCVSVWVAFPFGLWMENMWWQKLLCWWALSGAACLLEQFSSNKREEKKQVEYTED